MKKHLIAAAVAGLIAAPAMAQVTVYGNIEAGVLNTDADGAASTTALTNNIVNSSRLGFRGTEDLGAGLQAFFRLEQSLGIQTGRLGGSATNQMFDRGAEVGLRGSFGQVKIGKFDITGAENIDSAVSQMGNVGINPSSGIYADIGSDINHAIQYQSPAIGGFTVQIGHALKDGNSTTTGTVNDTTSFFVGGTVSGVNLQFGTTTDKTLAGVETTQTSFGASYNFGPVTAGVYHGLEEKDGAGDISKTFLSAVVPLGDGIAVHGVYQTYERAAYAAAKKTETEKTAIALSKAFSKRTTGYLGYVSTDVDGKETNQLYLGINHAF